MNTNKLIFLTCVIKTPHPFILGPIAIVDNMVVMVGHIQGSGVGVGGGVLGPNYEQMCVFKGKGNGSFFGLKGVIRVRLFSLKMNVKFAVSIKMGKN